MENTLLATVFSGFAFAMGFLFLSIKPFNRIRGQNLNLRKHCMSWLNLFMQDLPLGFWLNHPFEGFKLDLMDSPANSRLSLLATAK